VKEGTVALVKSSERTGGDGEELKVRIKVENTTKGSDSRPYNL